MSPPTVQKCSGADDAAIKTTPKPLTPGESRILSLAWQCMTTQPQVDVKKLGELAGLTSDSARTTFNKIKRKLVALGGAAASASTNGTNSENENSDGNASTPTANDTNDVDMKIPPGHTTAGAQSDRPKKIPRKRKAKTATDIVNGGDANGADGNDTNGAMNVDDSPTPKKRGRKTNAEKEREAATAAAVANQNNGTTGCNTPEKGTKTVKTTKIVNGSRRNNTSDEDSTSKDSGIGSSIASASASENDDGISSKAKANSKINGDHADGPAMKGVEVTKQKGKGKTLNKGKEKAIVNDAGKVTSNGNGVGSGKGKGKAVVRDHEKVNGNGHGNADNDGQGEGDSDHDLSDDDDDDVDDVDECNGDVGVPMEQ